MTRKQILLENLEIVIINDLSKSYVPLMLFNARLNKCIHENNWITQLLISDLHLELFYFNTIAGKMEPVVEPTEFIITMIINATGYPKMHLTIDT